MEDGPSAFAGAAKTVRPSSRVTLAGEGNSKRGASLAFAWTQVEGPAVALEDETTPTPTFEAPAAMGTRLAFELRVADGTLLSPASRVDVVVGFDGVATGSGCATAGAPATSASRGGLFASALAFALALARRRRRA